MPGKRKNGSIEPELFHGLGCDTTAPEQKLWQAVLLRAFLDATKNYSRRRGKWTDTRVSNDTSKAKRWLTGYNRDFHTVCTLAGFDANAVRASAKRALGLLAGS